MGIFKFDQEQNSRGWNYRQLCFNLKSRRKRQAVSSSKKDKSNLTGHKIDDDIRKILDMYFKGKSLEEAIGSVEGNNKEIINKLILIKDNWEDSQIIKGDLK